MKFYVYAYVDPLTDTPLYIGKGRGKRAHAHLRPCDLVKETPLSIHLRQMLSNGIRPRVIYLLTELTEHQSLQWEIFFVLAIGRRCDKSGPLFNMTIGGQGLSGRKHSAETKLKMSLAAKGRVISDQARQKMSASAKNRTRETKERQAAPRRGQKRSSDTRRKMSLAQMGHHVSGQTRKRIAIAAELRQYEKYMTVSPLAAAQIILPVS